MPTYRYRALAATGNLLSGSLEAPDRLAAVQRLQTLGHYPIAAEEVSEGAAGSLWAWLNRDLMRRHVTRRDLRLFAQQLATLLNAGLSLERSLEILLGLADADALRTLIGALLHDIRDGVAFSDAVARRAADFPPFFVSMVRAGEAGGALETVLQRIADLLERAHELRESIKSALVYPALLMVLSMASIAILLTVVLPQFKPLFDNAGKALPLSTRLIMALGDDVARYWWVAAAAIAAAALLARAQLRKPEIRRRWHGALIRLPLLGRLIAEVETARFSRTLATLLDNGVALLAAMQVAGQTITNLVIAQAVARVSTAVREGKGLAEPLAQSGAFPRLAVHMIRVGEETGELPAMLAKIAEIYEQEVKRTVERLMALLVPALTVSMGLIVAGIIVSMLTAILSVYDLAV
jgi:general secretion pathway protein F